MIIQLRGNHASGKSTAVRAVLAKHRSVPIYGVLGPRAPEAYRCARDGLGEFYVLGPYPNQPHGGMDVVTKKGVATTLKIFTDYSGRGDLLFESVQLSCRFQAPTIGKWLLERKRDVVMVILDIPLADLLKSLRERQAASEFHGGAKHMEAQQRQFENVQRTLKENGFRMIYVDRETVVPTILKLLRTGV